MRQNTKEIQQWIRKNPFTYLFLLSILIWLVPEKESLNIKNAEPTTPLPQHMMELGGSEDPSARNRWQWLMTRNPATQQIPARMHEKELAYSHRKFKNLNGRQANSWESAGPNNVGGRTRALAVDFNNENIWLAGGVSGGVWRSTNAGQSWVKTTAPQQLQSVTCIWQDITDASGNTWYYGTGELTGNSARGGNAPYRGDGMFKSTDNGLSWQPLASTQTNTPQNFDSHFNYIYTITQSSATGYLYIATIGGVFVSTDSGNSFQAVLNPPRDSENNQYLAAYSTVHCAANGVLYAALSPVFTAEQNFDSRFYTSQNGTNWTSITPSALGTFGRVVIDSPESNPNSAYFFVHRGEQPLLLKFENNSIINLTQNLPEAGDGPQQLDLQGGYNMIIKLHPTAATIFIGGTNLYRSVSGFATADAEHIGGYVKTSGAGIYENHHPDQHELLFLDSDPAIAISAHDGGLSQTNNIFQAEVSWQEKNNLYRTSQFYTVGLDESQVNELLLGGLQDNGTQANFMNGTNWQRVLGGDGGYTHVAYKGAFIYISFQNSQIYRLQLNNDLNITNFARVDPAGAGQIEGQEYLFVNPYVFDAQAPNRMYLAGGDRIWRNLNVSQIPNGSQEPAVTNWQALNQTAVSEGSISALALSRLKPENKLYYGTTQGRLFKVEEANVSAITTEITSSLFPEEGYIAHIEVNPVNGNELVVAFSNYEVQSIFRSVDGGQSFEHVSGNLEENEDGSGSGPSIRHVEIIPTLSGSDTTYLYLAGTSTGLYSSTELSPNTTWQQEGTQTIGRIVVPHMQYRSLDGKLAIATHGNGVYTTQIDNTLPLSFNLEGSALEFNSVYPNPYSISKNQPLVLRYTLPQTDLVRIRIYSSTGKLLSQPLLNRQIAGENELYLYPEYLTKGGLKPGVYIIRLDYGKGSSSQKVLIQP